MARVVIPLPDQANGGAGGLVTGTLPVSSGDVFTVWVAAAGHPGVGQMGGEGVGSYFGTPTNGGFADMALPSSGSGGGGGLTSVRLTGSSMASFTVPAGGGGQINAFPAALAAGEAGSGTATTRAGTVGTSGGGGGGAGENGGRGGLNAPGAPGAFGMLPATLTAQTGSADAPAGTSRADYGLCPSNTASGTGDGHACVVLRCAP